LKNCSQVAKELISEVKVFLQDSQTPHAKYASARNVVTSVE
jgi:hypothetical protein